MVPDDDNIHLERRSRMIILTLLFLLIAGPILLLVAKIAGALLYWPLRILGGLLSVAFIFMLLACLV